VSVELRHLRYVIAVAEELSFTHAARRLHIAQSALSARVKEVESAVGVPLFCRTTRKVEVTDAGERFVAEARLAVKHHEAAMRQARFSQAS
jgi:LysR family hca operon transcriptional activator